MEVYPLSIPTIDWDNYIDTYQAAFGVSPAAQTDSAGMKNDSPATFVASLDFENTVSPNDALRRAAKTMILEHSFCSFIYIGEDDLLNSQPLRLVSIAKRQIKKDQYYAIITGNIFQWRQVLFSVEFHSTPEIDEFGNEIKTFLTQAGFKEAISYE